MKFDKALKLMKDGEKVKLPSWGGYWCWDEEKQTIIMHCREKDSDTGKEALDIRETRRVEYTLRNVLSEAWILAIKYVKRGIKMKRKGWNGKNQYIELATSIRYMNPDGVVVNPDHKNMGNNSIAFVGTSGIQLGWLASQADILGEDWMFA